jgi:hypothetical protein
MSKNHKVVLRNSKKEKKAYQEAFAVMGTNIGIEKDEDFYSMEEVYESLKKEGYEHRLLNTQIMDSEEFEFERSDFESLEEYLKELKEFEDNECIKVYEIGLLCKHKIMSRSRDYWEFKSGRIEWESEGFMLEMCPFCDDP